ncbi:hypothetical protein [Sorangium cellulosum]|uniref:hypothetical protein n=1 Tax=Sorangium cellulosum TaxID=56 RepID=UPI0010116EDD|nr:hypothetical protein [Sorangium cellulosum]
MQLLEHVQGARRIGHRAGLVGDLRHAVLDRQHIEKRHVRSGERRELVSLGRRELLLGRITAHGAALVGCVVQGTAAVRWTKRTLGSPLAAIPQQRIAPLLLAELADDVAVEVDANHLGEAQGFVGAGWQISKNVSIGWSWRASCSRCRAG